jgi:hypothetical protein
VQLQLTTNEVPCCLFVLVGLESVSKITVFCVVKPCYTGKVKGCNNFLKKSVNFCQTARRYVSSCLSVSPSFRPMKQRLPLD